MGEYVKIAEIKDALKNQMQVFSVKGQEILLINLEGKFYAVDNRCPHMGYPLYFGRLEGAILRCGFHNAKFDVITGRSLNEITDKPLRIFKLKIHDSKMFVEL